MLCIAAALFHKPELNGVSDLESIHAHLGVLVGGGAALAFGIALMASGLSSSSVGTYAGQIVMAGFMNWRIPLLLRRALTMLPSLVVLALAADPSHAPGPLPDRAVVRHPVRARPVAADHRRDRRVMRDMRNRRLTSAAMLVITVVITGLNGYLLYDWLW